MPSRLAAARASREASERLAVASGPLLSRRAGSTQPGLPSELEDHRAGDTTATFARISATSRTGRRGSMDAMPVPSPTSGPSLNSVTFNVTSGGHGQHGTPTATMAALAGLVANTGVGTMSMGPGSSQGGSGMSGLPPRARSSASSRPGQPDAGSPHGPLGPHVVAQLGLFQQAGAVLAASGGAGAGVGASGGQLHDAQSALGRNSAMWGETSGSTLPASSALTQSQQHQQPQPLPVIDSQHIGTLITTATNSEDVGNSANASPIAAGLLASTRTAKSVQVAASATNLNAGDRSGVASVTLAAAAGSAAAAAVDQVWTAAASPTDRSVSSTFAAAPVRHSRLRVSVGRVRGPSGSPAAVAAAAAAAAAGARTHSLDITVEGMGRSPHSPSPVMATAPELSPGASDGGGGGGPGDYMTSPARSSNTGMWTATAARATSGISVAGSSSAGGTPGTTAPSSFVSRTVGPMGIGVAMGLRQGRTLAAGRPVMVAATGSSVVSELFAAGGGGGAGNTEEALQSVASSFTVRQTPSDMEDEMLDRARARRAVRTMTTTDMRAGGGTGRPSDAGSGAGPAGGAAAQGAGPYGAGHGVSGSGYPTGGYMPPVGEQQPGDSGVRVPIRLNHQPGHHRRPPNRHASMPAMKQDGANGSGRVHGGGGQYYQHGAGTGGLAAGKRSVAAVPPLEEGGVFTDNSPRDDGSLPLGLLDGELGDMPGPRQSGGGGGLIVAGYSRMPSGSPVTSQISITSSCVGGVGIGPGSAANPRYASTSALGGGGAGGSGAAISSTSGALPPAPAPQSSSRLAPSGGGAGGTMAHNTGSGSLHHNPSPSRSTMMGHPQNDSDMVRCSFEDEHGRTTPAFVGVPSGGGLGNYGGSTGTFLGANSMMHNHAVINTGHSGFGDRPSLPSGRLLASGAHAQHTSSLAALHKAVERLMLQDSGLYTKVQASMKGISSLAKETNKLEFVRDASGATVINQYVVVKTLGRGAFGKVKLCLNTLDGQLYAVKMINRAHLLRQLQKPARPLRRRAPPPRNTSDTGLMNLHLHRTQTEGNLSISHTNASSGFGNAAQAAAPARASMDDTSPLAAIMREIAVMKKVDHPHVVRLHEVIDPPGSSYLMMVMEYCEGGCVMETRAQTGLTPMEEDTAREYFRQACMGLDYLHYNNVVHGDLKPENMLVSGTGLLKIADFGSSRFMGGDPTDATKTSCTPAFQSPEEISHLLVDPFAADLWALACCLFTFVFGRLPFVGSCVVDIYRAILTRPHVYPADVIVSAPLRDLLDRMLNKDPKKRLQLRDVGKHPWVTAEGALPCLQSLASSSSNGGTEAPPPIIHVTHAEQVNAIDRSSLVSLIRARLKEKTCQPGEYLFKEGEEAHCVFMIMAGVVELTQHLRRPPPGYPGGPPTGGAGGGGGASGRGGGTGGGAGGGGGPGGESGDHEHDHDASFSVDLDESLTLDHGDGAHITEAMNIVDGKLHIDRQQAIEMRRRMQGQLLGDNAEYVVEVKGPGSVIGEMGLDNTTTANHRVSARARGPVTVVKLTEENFFKALLQMYGGGGGGGSQASTSITASSISEALVKAGGGGGVAAVGGVAAAGGHGAGSVHSSVGPGGPAMSAQHMMVMQYLEDSGSYATFQAHGPGPASTSGVAGPSASGRYSLDSAARPSLLRGGSSSTAAAAAVAAAAQLHQLHQQQQQQHQYGGASGGDGHRHHHHHHHHHGSGNGSGNGSSVHGIQGEWQSGSAPKVPAGGGGRMTPAESAIAAGGSHRALASLTGGSKNSLAAHSHLGVLNTIHSVNASRAGGNTSEEGIADL